MAFENYKLAWNDFQNNTGQMLNDIFACQKFTDVTLVCDDGQTLESNKLVLSASSTFLGSVLAENTNNFNRVLLQGAKIDHLKILLDFIHKGEVWVGKCDIQELYKLAKVLGVKGLSNTIYETFIENSRTSRYKKETNLPIQTNSTQNDGWLQNIKKNWLQNIPKTEGLEDLGPGVFDSSSFKSIRPPRNPRPRMTEGKVNPSLRSIARYNQQKVQQSVLKGGQGRIFVDAQPVEASASMDAMLVEREGGVWMCRMCGRCESSASGKEELRGHMRTHLIGLEHACDKCGVYFKSRNRVLAHISAVHTGVRL